MAARKKGSKKRYGKAASKRVESAMRRRKKGTLRSGKGGVVGRSRAGSRRSQSVSRKPGRRERRFRGRRSRAEAASQPIPQPSAHLPAPECPRLETGIEIVIANGELVTATPVSKTPVSLRPSATCRPIDPPAPARVLRGLVGEVPDLDDWSAVDHDSDRSAEARDGVGQFHGDAVEVQGTLDAGERISALQRETGARVVSSDGDADAEQGALEPDAEYRGAIGAEGAVAGNLVDPPQKRAAVTSALSAHCAAASW